jgi:hypothetical protein
MHEKTRRKEQKEEDKEEEMRNVIPLTCTLSLDTFLLDGYQTAQTMVHTLMN